MSADCQEAMHRTMHILGGSTGCCFAAAFIYALIWGWKDWSATMMVAGITDATACVVVYYFVFIWLQQHWKQWRDSTINGENISGKSA